MVDPNREFELRKKSSKIVLTRVHYKCIVCGRVVEKVRESTDVSSFLRTKCYICKTVGWSIILMDYYN